MTLSTPLAVPAAASPARRDRVRVAARWLDLVLPLGLVLAAFGLRLPYLWTIPRFSDETREALLAIEILHGNRRGPGQRRRLHRRVLHLAAGRPLLADRAAPTRPDS